ncbi:hypothetical protein DSO57_1006680 [Entomophthora muscae]|uniref:Uncharacterized protein n=1 Tax=Entomophthora muscae TaxID=34485 RepID=A0ACC2TIW4_9FUNG|nr:hypothetical protein DSO57_1006680 [Entomophthora muscae]
METSQDPLGPDSVGYNPILHFLPIVIEQEHLTILCLLERICEDQVFNFSVALS